MELKVLSESGVAAVALRRLIVALRVDEPKVKLAEPKVSLVELRDELSVLAVIQFASKLVLGHEPLVTMTIGSASDPIGLRKKAKPGTSKPYASAPAEGAPEPLAEVTVSFLKPVL
jgi:hypothetical protein